MANKTEHFYAGQILWLLTAWFAILTVVLKISSLCGM